MSNSVLIAGTGALATLFAARLSAAGVEVTMLGTWRQGLTALSSGGARLEGEGGYAVRVTDNPVDCRDSKIALVLVKSWQTEGVARQLVDCLAEDGLAVTLQNGLGNDEILAGILDPARVSRGVTTIGATLLGPGLVRLNGQGTVTLEAHPRLHPLESLMRIANFTISIVEDARPVIWEKLMINSAINPLTALLRIKNGELLNIPAARELMKELASETADVAHSQGVNLTCTDPGNAVEGVVLRTAENHSSMLQDVLRKVQTEVAAINGAVVRKGAEKNISTPVNRVVYSLVTALHPA